MGVSGHSGQLLDRRWWGDEWGPAAEGKYTADGLNPGRECRSMIGKRDKIGFTVLWNFSLSLRVAAGGVSETGLQTSADTTLALTILSCPHSQHSHRSFLLSCVCVLQTTIFIRTSNEDSRRFHNHGEGPYYLWGCGCVPISHLLSKFRHLFSIVF